MAATFTVGDGKTFSTIQAAVNSVPGDLSGEGKQHVQVFEKSGDYDEDVDSLTGFTNPSASDFIHIEAQVNHTGLAGVGIKVGKTTGSGGSSPKVFDLVAFTIVEGFEIVFTAASSGAIIGVRTLGSCEVLRNIIHDFPLNVTGSAFINLRSGSEICRNNIMYRVGGNAWVGINCTGGSGHIIQNNSISAGGFKGIVANVATGITIENNIVMTKAFERDCFSVLNSGTFTTSNNNISNDGTANDFGGTGHLVDKVNTDQFVDLSAGTEDLHLKSGADAIDAGKDLSGSFTVDIDNGIREVTWDMGADDFAVGPPTVSVISPAWWAFG